MKDFLTNLLDKIESHITTKTQGLDPTLRQTVIHKNVNRGELPNGNIGYYIMLVFSSDSGLQTALSGFVHTSILEDIYAISLYCGNIDGDINEVDPKLLTKTAIKASAIRLWDPWWANHMAKKL